MKVIMVLLGLLLSFAAQADVKAESILNIDEYRAPSGELSLFIRPITNFARSYIVLDAWMDGVLTTLENPTRDLWIYRATSAGSHTISFVVSVEDAKQADRLLASLQATDATIVNLRAAIAQTSDPAKLAALQAELNRNLDLKARLQRDLGNLKNPISREDHSFQTFNNFLN
jgi:hypothetical protein